MRKNKIRSLLPAAAALASLAFAASSAQAQIAVVNAASSKAGYPVAPGSLVSAYGAFAGASAESAASLPLPMTLGGAMVTVGGMPAPLLYVSAGQINLQIPWGVSLAQPAAPIVVTAGGNTVQGLVLLAETDPGLFGVVVNHADGSINSMDNPAPPEGVVIVYGTGIGPVDNRPEADGALPAELSTGTQPVRAFFGGAEGRVWWSGLSPEFVGLWQLNLQIPALPPTTAGPLPLLVTLGGRPATSAAEVTVYTAPPAQ